MSEKIYHIRWNDHESLIRATSNTDCRQQAQLLYGRDALSWRMCPVKVAPDEVLVRLVRAGKQILHFSLPVSPRAVVTAEKVAYATLRRGQLTTSFGS